MVALIGYVAYFLLENNGLRIVPAFMKGTPAGVERTLCGQISFRLEGRGRRQSGLGGSQLDVLGLQNS